MHRQDRDHRIKFGSRPIPREKPLTRDEWLSLVKKNRPEGTEQTLKKIEQLRNNQAELTGKQHLILFHIDNLIECAEYLDIANEKTNGAFVSSNELIEISHSLWNTINSINFDDPANSPKYINACNQFFEEINKLEQREAFQTRGTKHLLIAFGTMLAISLVAIAAVVLLGPVGLALIAAGTALAIGMPAVGIGIVSLGGLAAAGMSTLDNNKHANVIEKAKEANEIHSNIRAGLFGTPAPSSGASTVMPVDETTPLLKG